MSLIDHERTAASIRAVPAAAPITIANPAERRIETLDGLRGLMTIAVVLSHYFGELPHGITAFKFGWLAVDMFFVLSGYLIGTLILDKMDRANFFAVFYVRRACRTLPAYFLCVIVVFFIMSHYAEQAWTEINVPFPLWSYATFTQTFFMTATGSIGPHWLAPTWTLALEEHFYLVAPAMFFFVPRRHLISVMIGCALGAVLIRSFLCDVSGSQMGALVLLPSRADVLVAGVVLAVLIRTVKVDWAAHDLAIRVTPLVALVITGGLRGLDTLTGAPFFQVFGPFVVSFGCAAFIFALVREAPEARRFHSPTLRFFGSISYSTYLMHLTVLGLMHGFLLGTAPDLENLRQLAVTLAALPVTVFVGWALTKLVEEPITAYGRSWKWSDDRRT